ncbi:MAG: GNAT family N-acetyltransferase, partial [Thermosynechococcaceae cyanobacterium]
QRLGVGTQLIEQIEADARSQSIPRLFADVSITARPFFKRHGFFVEREQERLYRDVLFQQFLMAKSLVEDASRSTDRELIGRLRDAITNLDWTSEADYPLELQVWESPSSEPLTTAYVLALTNAPPESTLTEVDFAAFFEPAIQCQDWYGEEEVAIAQRYQRLVNLLQTELNTLQVFKVGEQEIDIYIVGRTPTNQCLGVTTKAIET